MDKRVVVTGLGAISPIGNDVNEIWKSIEEKKCGIDEITAFDTTNFKTKLAGEIKNYDSSKYFDVKQAKRLDKVSQYAIIAAREAFKDSKITKENTNLNNVGIFVGSGIGGIETIQKQCETNTLKGNSRVSPMFIPMGIVNMPAGNIAIDLGLKGESISIVTACSSATHSIGEA